MFPIIVLVSICIASLRSDSLSGTAFGVALLANQVAVVKNVVCKGTMDKPWAKALGSLNTYAAVCTLAFLSSLPSVLYFDANDALAVYAQVSL